MIHDYARNKSMLRKVWLGSQFSSTIAQTFGFGAIRGSEIG